VSASRNPMSARRVATAAVIAATYGALSFLVIEFLPLGLGNGFIQFRVSEALVVLAALTPAAIPGLALGTLLANLTSVASFGAIGLLDVVFGSLATLLAAWWTWRFRRSTPLALAGPVIFNALIVPAYLPLMLPAAGITSIPFIGISLRTSWPLLYGLGVVGVGIGEAVVVYGLGWPLLVALRRMRLPGIGEGV
jgi:uncharacterized membrane protein